MSRTWNDPQPQVNHVEAALSHAVIMANIHVSENQWETLCTVTRKELAERCIIQERTPCRTA